MTYDRTRVALFTELFASVAEEMGSVLERVSFSTNIKERRDYSCALFAPDGTLIAQAAHIPVHLGAMEFLLRRWLQEGPDLAPGRLYVCNDPFFAGTHLPDISVLSAVVANGKTIGYAASRAHHSDIGGSAPGSMAPSRTVHEEGVNIAPSELDARARATIYEASRNPEERKGDLDAQEAAAFVGGEGLRRLYERFGDQMFDKQRQCVAYAEEMTRTALQGVPAGTYEAEDVIEDIDGEDAVVRCRLMSDGKGHLEFDFSGTDDQVPLAVNATEAVTRSACYYVVRCLSPQAPTNGGCWKPVEVNAPLGSLVNAQHPAPVAAGNTEMSQRIVDVVMQCLARAVPDRIPACSQGTMNNVAIGGDSWSYYETIGGGHGGGPKRDGCSGRHCHMTNTRNTPAEALEIELPLRLTRNQLRTGTGGTGRHAGGDGIVREFEFLDEAGIVSLMTDRRSHGPPGSSGGTPGTPGKNTMIRNGQEQDLESKVTLPIERGDRLRIDTPGGGGWGD